MVLETGKYRLDVDEERTKAYYSTDSGIVCDCAGCRNYEKALPQLAEPINRFLCQFGIDPRKPMELSVLHSPDGKKVFYDGIFHICANLLAGKDPWIQTGPKSRALKQDYVLDIHCDCSAYFISDCALIFAEKEFPRPVTQLHIFFALPWLLDGPNPYC